MNARVTQTGSQLSDQFLPIDEAAKLAGPLLLRATDGTLHSGRWSGTEWTYSSSPHHAINRPIAAYRPRKGHNHG